MSLQQDEENGLVTIKKFPNDTEVNAIAVVRKRYKQEVVDGELTLVEDGEESATPETKESLQATEEIQATALADTRYKLNKF